MDQAYEGGTGEYTGFSMVLKNYVWIVGCVMSAVWLFLAAYF